MVRISSALSHPLPSPLSRLSPALSHSPKYYVPLYPDGPLTGGLLGPLADFRHSTDGGKTWDEPRVNATSASDNLFGETGPLPGETRGP